MIIEVKNLLNQPEGSSENHPLDLNNLALDTETTAKFIGEATLTNLDDFILAQISGEATFNQPCSRCLEAVALSIPLNFSREFKTQNPSIPPLDKGRLGGVDDEQENEDTYPIEDGEIDLAAPIIEEIIANIPVKILCTETCLGLCPTCGNNLNDNPCQCDKVNYEIRNRINL